MKRERAEEIARQAMNVILRDMISRGQAASRCADAIMEAVAEATAGLKPELPPRPDEGGGLPRYGLRWNGPTEPLSVPMADGYWTPWHLAERYRDRVAELEAAKGEPGVWLRDQRGHYEGRETLDPMFYLGARNPGRGANGATYSPFYAAPPAPTVDVDAISDEALMRGASEFHHELDTGGHRRSCMRYALRAIFNKGE